MPRRSWARTGQSTSAQRIAWGSAQTLKTKPHVCTAFSPSGKALWESHLEGFIVRAAPAVRRDGRGLVVVGQKFSGDGALNERVFLVDQRNGASASPLLAERCGLPPCWQRAATSRSISTLDGFSAGSDRFLERAGTDLGGMVFDFTSTSGVWDFLGDVWNFIETIAFR